MSDNLTKQEIKNRRICEALTEIADRDIPLVQSGLVGDHVHRQLHEADFFDGGNLKFRTIPDDGEIKSFMTENDDLGFAKIVDVDVSNKWVLQKTKTDSDQNE